MAFEDSARLFEFFVDYRYKRTIIKVMVISDAKGGNKSNKKKLQIPQAITATTLSREMLPVIVSYVYIFLPVVLFALMWTKIFIGLPVAAVIVYGLYRSEEHTSELQSRE